MAKRPRIVYPNLAAEMARSGISRDDIAKIVHKTPDQVSNWLSGKSGDFSVTQAFEVHQTLFPTVDIAELFRRNNQKQKVAE